MLPRTPLTAGIAVCVALLTLPAAVSAAGPTRYAAPGGLGIGTCATPATACTLQQALTIATATADEVVVGPGDYDLGAAGATVGAANNVHGVDGQPRPVIHGATATPLVSLGAPGATLRHLAVRQDGTGSAVSAPVAATLADLELTGPTAAQLGTGTVMTGSTALGTGGSGVGIDVAALGTPVLHNVTAWASGGGGTAIRAPAGAAVTGTNVIARAPAGADTGGAGLITLATSNFGSAPAPLLTNPAGGDFHQRPGSPTIDAGVPDPLAGLTDIDGDPRILGATQDIGADEYISHRPAATTGSANGSTVTGTVMPNGLPTSYRFDFGLTPLYGSSTPTSDAGAGTSATQVSAPLPNLTPGSLVHYRVVATNVDGETAGLDRVLVVPGTLTGAQANVPHFTALDAPTTATVGQTITITAAGRDRNDPVNSIAIDFDDGPAFFAESACRVRPPDPAFRNSRLSTYSVPYAFTTPGVHTVQVTLGSGDCGKSRQQATQSTQITVLPASKRLARVRVNLAEAAANCPDSGALPSKRNTRKVERATLCLLNQARRQNGLKALKPNAKLHRAARMHNNYMIRGRFFAHQGRGEPPLGKRFGRVRYRAAGGENIGAGVGNPFATPRGMVAAWLNSPVHRANIMERAFRAIGISIVAEKPLPPPPRPGATYTTEFGTRR